MQKFVDSAGTEFIRRIGLQGCILPEIRAVRTEGHRLHFRYHRHGVVERTLSTQRGGSRGQGETPVEGVSGSLEMGG